MQHILIPTDFSLNAWNAIEYSFQFYRREHVTFHLLHIETSHKIVQDKDLHTAGFLSLKEIDDEIHDEMKVLLEQVRAKNRNKKHRIIDSVIKGRFIERIREYVIINCIDIIVMGTKGASGIKERTLGSYTGAVITKVKCPILVIPEEATYIRPANIGFPTDFNIPYTNKVLRILLGMSKTHNSMIKVLRVAQNQQPLNTFQNANRNFLNKCLFEAPHSFHVVENKNLDDAIQSFIGSFEINMIVMIAKSLNLFQRILFNPRIKKISYHSKIPFLVLHE